MLSHLNDKKFKNVIYFTKQELQTDFIQLRGSVLEDNFLLAPFHRLK